MAAWSGGGEPEHLWVVRQWDRCCGAAQRGSRATLSQAELTHDKIILSVGPAVSQQNQK